MTVSKNSTDSQALSFQIASVDIIPVEEAIAAHPSVRNAFMRMVKEISNSPDVFGVAMFVLMGGDVARTAPCLMTQDDREHLGWEVWSPDQWKTILNQVVSGQTPQLPSSGDSSEASSTQSY